MSTDVREGAAPDLTRIRAVFEIVTPMFLGGALPAETAELRPASIKGALRFWWRALAWGRHWNRLHQENGTDPAPHDVLQAIWKEEARLFGSAASDGEGSRGKAGRGQASFLLRAGWEGVEPKPLKKNHSLKPGPGACYLGYGLMTVNGQLSRPAIPEGAQFWVTLQARKRRNDTSAAIDCTVVAALKLFGLIGGLGARTRRGWGSVRLLSLRCGKGLEAEAAGGSSHGCGCELCSWKPPADEKEFLERVREILEASEASADGSRDGLPPGEPPYSAFVQNTRMVVAPLDVANALSALNYVGNQMHRYRGWRPPGEKRFEDDHDWFVTIPDGRQIRRDQPEGHPRRVVFGLPHNYFGREHQPQKAGVLGERHDRRASPLFSHIGKFGGEDNAGGGANARARYFAVLTIFPAQFLPPGERFWIWRRKPNRPRHLGRDTLRRVNIDWNFLQRFIDGIRQEDNKFYFPKKKELWSANTGES